MLEFREPLFLLLGIVAIPLFFWMRRPVGTVRISSLDIWPRKIFSFKSKTAFIAPLLTALAWLWQDQEFRAASCTGIARAFR